MKNLVILAALANIAAMLDNEHGNALKDQIRPHKAGRICQEVYGMHLGIARIVDVDLESYQMREVPRGDSESTDMQFSETAPEESRARRPRCDPPRPVRPSAAVRTRAWR